MKLALQEHRGDRAKEGVRIQSRAGVWFTPSSDCFGSGSLIYCLYCCRRIEATDFTNNGGFLQKNVA